ncbi:dihydrofolate synthase/folylpolyglutamate synthase [Metabacillus crassostreae]|uniref:bifunctional folylpolyglutamate synthase/dihydrofolate synthase n=1 Tax=Metabacillus crassostreae TaxID=929098 RepID=UPI001959CDF7|nr:folylpolyglutamate synthase/dihydrofolate synthase family protein [Metabacillus crassostreae]MBM7605740.1 dihydrofolate synthase/folylpolyglutamate synthase [Metabacillus crassostreae]
MFNTYEEALNWIHGRLKFGVKPGLKRMEWLLEQMNSPERNIPIIHVAGTNGKGSTISYLLHMLTEAGYDVGTFTSPYIETFNERISVNGKPISNQEMLQLANEVKPYVDKAETTELGGPTEFEIITTMMFLYFGKYHKPDFVLLETGLGGRLDSTNIVTPILSIITNVGYDHMNILGSTISEIASEKAGIIKQGIPVFTGSENKEVVEVFSRIANQNQAPLFKIGEEFQILNSSQQQKGEMFSMKTNHNEYNQVSIMMKGQHQVQNATLAIAAIDYLNNLEIVSLKKEHIYAGINKAFWMGRFEQIYTNPEVIIDGAHNKEGIESLINTVNRHYPNRKIHILFSALKDKEYSEMINRLTCIATSISFTTFDFPRAASSEELFLACEFSKKDYFPSWRQAVEEMLIKYENKDDLILITGSLYFISTVREYVRKK